MKPINKIKKGKKYERWFVDKLRNTGIDPMASRTPGSGSGLKKGDIWTNLPYSFELKAHKRSSVLEWMRQCEEDAKTHIGSQPCVVWRPDRTDPEDSIVMIRLYTFIELLKKSKEPKTLNTDNQQARWEIKTLIQSAKKVLKRLEG